MSLRFHSQPGRELAKNVLETFGYRALMASDGAEAMAIYAERRDEIQLVVTDLMMPVMDGPTTIRACPRHWSGSTS